MKRSKLTFAVAACAALALTVSGCQQGQSKDTKVDQGDAQKQAAQLPATAWKKGTAKEGGTLTMAITDLPSNFNYSQADGAEVNMNRIAQPMGLGGCATVAADGKVVADPNYLTEAKVVSKDPQVIELKFNPKAVWSDGAPMGPKDVVAYWKATQDEAFQIASTQGWQDMTKVEAVDAQTVRLTYKAPFAEWMNYLCPTVPESVSSDAKKFNEGYATQATPSSGPYKVDTIDNQAKVVTLVRNDKWWGDKPKLEKIVYRAVSQSSQAQAFAGNAIDLLEISTDADAYKTAQGVASAEIQKSNGTQWTHVTLNTERGGLKDPKVREAIGHLVNRDLIAKAAIGPVEAPVVRQDSMIYMPGQQGYQPNGEEPFKLDPTKAAQILDEAGYKKGEDGVRAKGADKLQFKIVIPADTQSNELRATQVMKDLNAAGFKVELQTVPTDQYFKTYVNKHDFDMVTFTWEGTPFPIAPGVNLYSPGSKQNYTGLKDPKITELAATALADLDDASRAKKANDLDKQIVSNRMVIPFYVTPFIWGVKKGLVNYGPSQFESADWTKVGFE